MGEVADRGVREALAGLASPAKPQAAGVACAFAGASAAALVELTAGLAAERIEASGAGAEAATAQRLRGLARQAAELRERVLAAADEDAQAYARVLAARQPGTRARALLDAADPPLTIAECAAEVAVAAAEVADSGAWAFTADAEVAVELARTAARGAASLVEVNLAANPDDPRVARARSATERAEGARHGAD